jgi:CubicO group peptidase (beta-lactamase class C family)
MSDHLDRRSFVTLAGMLTTGIVASSKATAAADEPVKKVAIVPAAQIHDAREALDGLAREIMRRSGIPGMAIAIVADGKVAFASGYGVRRTGEPSGVDPDTVFQLASLSKSIAATVVARQVDAGLVTWDTPIVAHLPWFQLADPWVGQHVTIADMFSHRSGLPDHGGDDLEDIGFDRRAVLERLRLLPLQRFRDNYAYTNFGLTAAAEAVAMASGKDWAALSEEVLYAPLGLSSTSSRFSDFERRTNRAVGHVRIGDAYEARLQRNPDAQSPAGGVSASVNDLARWMIMVLGMGNLDGRQFISPKALLPAVSVQTVSQRSAAADVLPRFYGYGFGVGANSAGRVEWSHSGAFGLGAATRYVMIPAAGFGIAVLTNAAPCGAAEAMAASISDYIELGRVSRDWLAVFAPLMKPLTAPVGDLVGKTAPVNPAPAAPLASYAGTYANRYFGDLTIVIGGDHLQLKIGPKSLSYPLRHWQGDVFAISPVSENEPYGSLSSVTFRRADGAAATDVTIDYLNHGGAGRFTRP